jgi:uncharacterized protein YjiS (DUF1127 family)
LQQYWWCTAQVTLSSTCDSGWELPGKELAMFKSIARRFHTWRRYGAAVNELSHLSDRELADIGISRSDIPRVAWIDAHHAR